MLSLNPGNLDTWAAALATAAIEDRDVDSILKQAFTSPSSSSSSRGGEDGPASVGDFVDERPTSEKILPISGGCSKYDRPDGMSSLSTLQHSENLSQATDSANEWIVVSNNKEPPSSATSDCQLIPVKKQQKSSTKIKTFLSSKKFKIATSVAAGALGVVGAITAAPIVVAGLGFTSAGIAAGSTAATMMSALGGGATAAGSTVAILQSVGATGAVLGSVAATGVATAVGGAVGAGVGVGVNAGIDAVIGDKSSDDDTVGSTETN